MINNTFESYRYNRNNNQLFFKVKNLTKKYYPFLIMVFILGGILIWSVQNFTKAKAQNSDGSVIGLNEVPATVPTVDESDPNSGISPTEDPAVLGDNTSVDSPTPDDSSPTDTITSTPTPTVTPTGIPTPTSTLLPDSGHSSFSANPNNIPPDGTTKSLIAIILKDNNGNVLSGATVSLSTSDGDAIFSTTASNSNITDSNGQATFYMTSANPGTDSINVTSAINGNSNTLSGFGSITINSFPDTPTPENTDTPTPVPPTDTPIIPTDSPTPTTTLTPTITLTPTQN